MATAHNEWLAFDDPKPLRIDGRNLQHIFRLELSDLRTPRHRTCVELIEGAARREQEWEFIGDSFIGGLVYRRVES